MTINIKRATLKNLQLIQELNLQLFLTDNATRAVETKSTKLIIKEMKKTDFADWWRGLKKIIYKKLTGGEKQRNSKKHWYDCLPKAIKKNPWQYFSACRLSFVPFVLVERSDNQPPFSLFFRPALRSNFSKNISARHDRRLLADQRHRFAPHPSWRHKNTWPKSWTSKEQTLKKYSSRHHLYRPDIYSH